MSPAPKTRLASTLTLAIALASLIGCSLAQSRNAKESDGSTPNPPLTPTSANGPLAELIAPRRCTLRLAILARPLGDPALNDQLWGSVDEQVLPAETRHALEANGLRLGVLTGDLPPAARAVLDAPPPHKVDPKTILLPDGESSLVELRAATSGPSSLLLNLAGKTTGKDYEDPRGAFRVTPTATEGNQVRLRLVPQIDHGPMTSRYEGAPTAGPFDSQQFIIKNGKQEETFIDLAATPSLQANQVAILGARTDRRGSIGDFLLTEAEPNSDRILQKVVLIWATPTDPATANAPAPLLEALEAAAKGPARP